MEILPHLYLGCEFHAASHSTLERLAITALLNVSRTSPILPGVQFAYKRIPVDDSGSVDISSWFKEAIQFIGMYKMLINPLFSVSPLFKLIISSNMLCCCEPPSLNSRFKTFSGIEYTY